MRWDIDDWGGGLYAVRGHVDAEVFATAVAAYNGADMVRPACLVVHEWFRYVPDEDGGGYWHARPGSRGAFKVTCGRLSALSP